MRTHEENLEWMNTRQEYTEAYLSRVSVVETESYTIEESDELKQFGIWLKETAQYLDEIKLATDERRMRFLARCGKIEDYIEAHVFKYELDITDEDYD